MSEARSAFAASVAITGFLILAPLTGPVSPS
jgi:hypothetical protein